MLVAPEWKPPAPIFGSPKLCVPLQSVANPATVRNIALQVLERFRTHFPGERPIEHSCCFGSETCAAADPAGRPEAGDVQQREADHGDRRPKRPTGFLA